MRVYTSLTKEELLQRGFVADKFSKVLVTYYLQYGPISFYFDERGGIYLWYIEFQPLSVVDPTLPAAIEDLLPKLGKVAFTAHVTPLGYPATDRAVGHYRFKSASMLWIGRSSGDNVIATDFSDLCTFVSLFHRGLIRPVVEFGERQVETPPRELRKLLREFICVLKVQMTVWKSRLDRWQARQA